MSIIGTCDCCGARNVELVRSELAGLETWSCWEGCEPEPQPLPTMPCEECGGDGGFERPISHDPFRDTIQYAYDECRACGGSSAEEIEMLPLELDDLVFLMPSGDGQP